MTSPPTRYEVTWLDAAHESDFDGPSAEAGGLQKLPYLGYHVSTRFDQGRQVLVLGSEYSLDPEGRQTSRFHLTIPVSWILAMEPVYTRKEVSSAPEIPETGTLGRGGVSRLDDVPR